MTNFTTNPSQGERIAQLIVKSSFLLKKKFYQLLLTTVVVLIAYTSSATIYYVSSSGNDANSGTSTSAPWKTLTRVNSFTPKAGDQILFKRGEQWTGTITVKASGTSGSPIVYSAYGTGNKPEIYGSEKITDWTLHSGKIYKATLTNDITQLFADDVRQTLARYPKTGYHTITTVNSTTEFVSTEIDGGVNYIGCSIILKARVYKFNSRLITVQTGQTLTMDVAPEALEEGYGFFLTNKLEFVTQAGDWYYDTTTKTVYFWTPNGDSPANYAVRGSTIDNGIYANNKSYIAVKNIEVLQTKSHGIFLDAGTNNLVDNCHVTNVDGYGILAWNGSNNTVFSNNYVYGASAGLYLRGLNVQLIGNTAEESGRVNNLNKTVLGSTSIGMLLYGSVGTSGVLNSIAEYNTIINSGKNGLTINGNDNIVRYNYINGSCLDLTDGGGIYSYNSTDYAGPGIAGTVISDNIIVNTYGEYIGTPLTVPSGSHAIYMDNGIRGVTIKRNTVTLATGGIFCNTYGGDMLVDSNTVYNTILGLSIGSTMNAPSYYNNNIVFAANRRGGWTWSDDTYQRLIYGQGAGVNLLPNHNHYYAPYSTRQVFTNFNSFEEYKAATGYDANSTFDGTQYTTEVEELFYNATKTAQVQDLSGGTYVDLNRNPVTSPLILQPFTSKILIKTASVLNIDTSKPVITAFTIPSTSTSLVVAVSSLSASDNKAVTGYLLTESATTPLAGNIGWTVTAPVSYSFASEGSKTIYAWAKDAAGNVSASLSDQVTITLPVNSDNTLGNTEVYASSSATANRRAMPVTFTETGEIQSITIYHNGGTGNILLGVYSDASGLPSAQLGVSMLTTVNATAGWQTIPLKSPVSVNSEQKVWLAWIFQNSVAVRYTSGTPGRAQSTATWTTGMPTTFGESTTYNNKFSIYCNYTTGIATDIIKPVVTAFTVPSTSTSLVVAVSSLTASDNEAVTGYLLTESATTPLAGNAGWTVTAPVSYSFASEGTKTLYAWAKDAAGNVSASLSDQVTITLPVNSDNTLGNTEVYASSSATANRRAMPVTFTETGEIQSITIYHNGGTGNVLLGVYSDASGLPSAQLGITASTTVNANAGWQTISLKNPVSVNSGQKVWLAWVFQNSVAVRYTSGTPGRAQSKATWTTGMPTIFGGSSILNNKFSIYCTYKLNITLLKGATVPEENDPKSSQTKLSDNLNKTKIYLSDEISIDLFDKIDFNIYPNPANSFVNIEFLYLPKTETRILMFDGTGRTVFQKIIDSSLSIIDVSEFPAGVYYIQSDSQQRNTTKKLIISK